jgi:Na+/glutamate symporter
MMAMIDCHFMAHFLFMKCECVVTGHCAQIELSLYLSLGLIGLMMVKLAKVVVVAVVVVVVIVVVVMVARATIKVQATVNSVQVVI